MLYFPAWSGCLYGLADNRDFASLLRQLVDLGFGGVRVFAGHLEGRGQTAQSARERLPLFLKTASDLKLFVEVTINTDTKSGYDIRHHTDQVARICAAYPNVALEIANEIGHPTQVDFSQAFLQELYQIIRNAGFTGPIAYGAALDLDELDVRTGLYPYAGGDYISIHLARGKNPWYREACRIREQEAVSAKHNKPVLNNEPNRVESTENPVAFAFLQGCLPRFFGGGSIFHSGQVRDVQRLDGIQLEAAKAFISAYNTANQFNGRYTFKNARWSDSPIGNAAFVEGDGVVPGKTVWRCYSFLSSDNEGYLVVVGPNPDDPRIEWQHGWRSEGIVAFAEGVRIHKIKR